MNPTNHSTYRTIYADPPWPEYGGGKIKRGADRHYPLMSLAAILQLGDALQGHIDDQGCHLYLWVTNTHLANGFRVLEQWGFDYKTTITWCKDRFGLGQYYRGQTEHCLFGVRGRLPHRRGQTRARRHGHLRSSHGAFGQAGRDARHDRESQPRAPPGALRTPQVRGVARMGK
jgi:N6-adenosine-specific RNA methylase IME4